MHDVIFDAVDNFRSEYRQAFKETGVYLNIDACSDKIKTKDVPFPPAELKELAETGRLKAVIDRCCPWEQIVEAHWYVDQGHKRGNVARTVAREGQTG